ncbi:MAG: DUF58 domain-containing protein [Ruminococcaceae bacterium]|nr:DUF58 domain-containing protein [Oscillospiraceae bacterium]
MKKTSLKHPSRSVTVRLRWGTLIYLCFLVFCVIFTQALYSPVSAVIFIFALLLPPAELLLFAVSCFFVTVEVEDGRKTIVRGHRLSLPVRVINHGLIPVSQCEVVLSAPKPFSLHSMLLRKNVTLPSFSACEADLAIPFAHRGLYQAGVEEIYLSDFLHLIRVRRRIRRYAEVWVLPRHLDGYGVFQPTEGTVTSAHSPERHTHADYGDIREYRPGDFMKSIHWKLSTKTEELQVRKRSSDVGRTVLIVCDLGGKQEEAFSFMPHTDIHSDDGVVEEAFAVACEAAALGASGIMAFTANGESRTLHFSDLASAERLQESLVVAEGEVSSEVFARLVETMPVSEGVSVLYVTAFLSHACEERLMLAARQASGLSFTICLCDNKAYAAPERRHTYETEREAICRRFSSVGIRVVVPRRKEDAS